MKNKVLKTLGGLGVAAMMTLTFTMNSNANATGDITLDNIAALNTAQAECNSGDYCDPDNWYCGDTSWGVIYGWPC